MSGVDRGGIVSHRLWIVLFILACAATQADEGLTFRHGLSFLGGLKYQPDFEHFDWVNPDAPKGGHIRLGQSGRFDTLNPWIGKGRTPPGLAFANEFDPLFDRLLQKTADEAASFYGRLAHSVALAPDLSRIVFRLRASARWHDGVPITAKDVKFTFDMIKAYGNPTLRTVFRDVTHATIENPHQISFHIKPGVSRTRNTAIFLSQIYPFAEHHWRDRKFNETTVVAPLASGPYRIAATKEGRYARYERVEDYWGRDLPVNRGRYNFDSIIYDYYLDSNVLRESLKADLFDVMLETVAKDWASTYNTPEVAQGLMTKRLIKLDRPQGFPVAFLWNLRLPRFQDIRVREALWRIHDFEWSNRVLFHDFYVRADSYFSNTHLGHNAQPPSAAELELLEPFRDQLPARVFTGPYRMPKSSGLGIPRNQLEEADRLLTEAGWIMVDGKRVNATTGQPFTVAFLFAAPALERVAEPYINLLHKLGMGVSMRTVEVSNYLNRMRRRAFEATVVSITATLTPGADLRSTFGSEAADIDLSRNSMGIKNPVVDALIEKVVAARTAAEHMTATRALDRVLLWNFYGIPGFYAPGYRYIHWNRFGYPINDGLHRSGFPETWWFDADRASSVEAAKKHIGTESG